VSAHNITRSHKRQYAVSFDKSSDCIVIGYGSSHISAPQVYAFSTENWGRPREEIDGLMHLLVRTLRSEIETLTKNNISLTTIGDISSLPQNCQYELSESIKATSENNGLTLVLALNYSGRWELKEAIKEISHDIKTGIIEPNDISQSLISSYLNTRNIPDPELLIRTSGEMRVSNFLLWQIAYTELYVTEVLWPDFRKKDLHQALISYQKRERRFGKISEQVKL